MSARDDDKQELPDHVKPNWNTRENMMSEEEIERLAAEHGQPKIGKERADQAGHTGPQPYGDPSVRLDAEGGPQGKLLRKKDAENEHQEQPPAKDWTKYDWS